MHAHQPDPSLTVARKQRKGKRTHEDKPSTELPEAPAAQPRHERADALSCAVGECDVGGTTPRPPEGEFNRDVHEDVLSESGGVVVDSPRCVGLGPASR